MRIVVCTTVVTLLSYFCSDFIKKYSTYLYSFFTAIAILVAIHSIFMVNNYSVTYIPIVKDFMRSIDSGALGGALFILVMYMGVLDMKIGATKKLRRNRAELSILACIVTLPHNIHYTFDSFVNRGRIAEMQGMTLWMNLMMLVAGLFAVAIMIPLFITSFKFAKRKMKGKSWKNLQQFAYFFYALIFIEIIMVYLSRPSGFSRNFNLVFYSVVFGTYTVLKLRIVVNKYLTNKEKAKKKLRG